MCIVRSAYEVRNCTWEDVTGRIQTCAGVLEKFHLRLGCVVCIKQYYHTQVSYSIRQS